MANKYYKTSNNNTAYEAGLSAHHIASDLENYEAARSGFFTLVVNDIDNLPTPTTTLTSDDDFAEGTTFAKAQKNIMLNVVKFTPPKFSVETLEYRRGNELVKFAGVPTFESSTLVVDDVVGLQTKDILYAWYYLVYNPNTQRAGRMSAYKKNCTLVEYTQDYEKVRAWELTGCWISELSEDDFDKESDGKRQVTCTIEYDWATPMDVSKYTAVTDTTGTE